MPIPFDTHMFITDLTHAGMPEAQATVLSDTLTQIYGDHTVTKQDLELAVAKIEARFATIENKIESRFGTSEAHTNTRFATLEGQIAHLRYLGYAIFAASVLKFFIK